MEFGFFIQPYARFPDFDALMETVQMADQLGFHSVAFGEHVIWPTAQLNVIGPIHYDSIVLGTAIAASTKHIKVCFSVLVLPYHHPIRLAKSISTLDNVAHGRLIVGIGVGWLESEFETMAVPFKERGAMTDEYIKAMKELWTSDAPRFDGRYCSFKDIAFEPRPVQKPHPPLVIGGYSHRAIVRAAELGDGMHPGIRPWEKLQADVAELKRLLIQRHRDPRDFHLSYTVDFGVANEEISRQYRLRGIPEQPPLSFKPKQALKQIAAYAGLGFSHLVVRFPGSTHREVQDSLKRFHETILAPLE